MIYDWLNTVTYGGFGKLAPKVDAIPKFSTKTLQPSTVSKYSSEVASSLRLFGAFKINQHQELFRASATLVRESTTLPLKEILQQASKSSSINNRYCITGPAGIGKSELLTQASAIALMNGFVVIPIPRCGELISGETDFVYDKATDMYDQPMYTKTFLDRIFKGNKDVLSTLLTSKDYSITRGGSTFNVKKDSSLYSLKSMVKQKKNRADILSVLLQELSIQEQSPVLFTVDDINVFTHTPFTNYLDNSAKPIYHKKFQITNLILSYLSGEKSFKNGAVLASTKAHYGMNLSMKVALSQTEPQPYLKIDEYDANFAESLRNNGGVKVINVDRLSREESASLVEYYHQAEILYEEPTSALLDEKYFLSGNGNPKQLMKVCLPLPAI
ncbi:hypothetical protein NADFUDRAFT_22961 [Nadsonia fulvescens var. elongata DSM 6958]|uniref:Small ribosomal subunit protein mS29 n=1 Tax=Nadsonia fulvescens var. elongata DSM 6958 TaxID=857566 RepID=A0A1E3PLX7_9ASCO|nr:hypothetical protein NADFUDRAFT_22961 [Nadsonia fulvescens var. elongata DSM 6958]